MPFTTEELKQLAADPSLSQKEKFKVAVMLANQERDQKMGPEGGNQLAQLGRSVQTAAGFVPNPLIRIPGVALGGIGADLAEGGGMWQALKNQANPLEGGVMSEAVFPGLSRVKAPLKGVTKRLSGGMANLFPEGGLQVGLRLGGLKGDVNKATDAFLRERGRHGWFGGVLPSTVSKVERRTKALGTKLEQTERAAPGRVNLSKTTKPAMDMIDPTGSSNPRELAERAAKNQSEFTARRKVVKNFGTAPTMVGNPPFPNVRQMGDIKRRQQREASKLIEARLSGASPYDAVDVRETMSANRAKLLKEAQEQLAPELAPLNQNISDLLSIKSVNKSLRGGGGIIQDVGGLGVRGGVGFGVGSNIAGKTGGRLGGILGMTLLNPKLAAGTGFALGRAAEGTPTLMRILQQLEAQREQEGE